MANIASIVQLIRTVVYGKDMRESIAQGIEAISNQQDTYEQNLTNEQNTFQTNITNQQNSYETQVTGEWTDYKENMDADEATRSSNEDTRKANEITRQANEVTRQEVYNDFRDFVNTAQQINRVPYLFDGGDFGDATSPVLTLNGGDF